MARIRRKTTTRTNSQETRPMPKPKHTSGPAILTRANMSALIREEVLDGVTYKVAPMIGITQGVTNGVFYSPEELGTFAESWNGVPLTMFHPKNATGQITSANSPEQREAAQIGWIFNSSFDGERLKQEAWIDPEKANKINPALMMMLSSNLHVEVSTGMFQEEVDDPGEFNGVPFETVARNIRPDHMAVLPGGEGGCNWAMGAGLPRNNAADGQPQSPLRLQRFFRAVGELFAVNEISHEEVRSRVRDAIRATFPGTSTGTGAEPVETPFVFMEEMHDDFVIYERGVNGVDMTFKQSFAVGTDDQITLVGDPIQVERVIKWVPVPAGNENAEGGGDAAASQALSQDPTRGVTVNTGPKSKQGDKPMDRAEQVSELIAHSDWTDDERELLEAMDEPAFEKVVTNTRAKADPPPGDPAPAADPAPVEDPPPVEDDALKGNEAEDEKPKTVDQYLADAPPEMAESFREGLRLQKERKGQLITGITANTRNKFTPEQLLAKGIPELEQLAALAEVPPADFSGRNTGSGAVAAHEAQPAGPPPMPSIDWTGKGKAA